MSAAITWVPALDLNLSFILDGFSLSFALLISGIGAMVFFYAQAYMKKYAGTDRFILFLTLFSGAMLGMVLSENLIQLFIFWELTSVLSFLLITFFHEKEEARKAAFQSLYITAFGGLSLLAGIILLGTIPGSYSLNEWIASAEAIRESSLYLPGLLLILLGVVTKSAQFPFHFWLPGAMQAPTPVSSYLHSATMVKAGFFLLARLHPVLGGTSEWMYIISSVGVITMFMGVYFAVTKTELKSILAYTTINALGVLVLLMGIDTQLSIKAALLFLFVHALYKATLFMVAGLIDKKAGTKEFSSLGGLARTMPLTFVITSLSALSMAGIPPMLGFLGKELIYEAKVQLPGISSVILVIGVAANILLVAVSLTFIYRIFLVKRTTDKPIPKEDRKSWLLLAPAMLAILSLLFGLFPKILGGTLIESALGSVIDGAGDVKLKLWHGFNDVFFLSLFTVVAGFMLTYLMNTKQMLLKNWQAFNERIVRFSLSDKFLSGVDGFVGFADKKTQIIQHGYHRYYIMTIMVLAAVAMWYQFYASGAQLTINNPGTIPYYMAGLVLVSVFAVVMAMFSRSRLAAIVAMGVVGYGIALVFMYYGAIDLAITQILAETLIVVLFVLVMQKMPRFLRLSDKKQRVRDLVIAIGFGTVMTLVTIQSMDISLQPAISDFFIENSWSKAFGKNVVNVILVDFRAMDTLGEIIVLAVAALGVSMLLKKGGKA
ncbi:MAG: DUF4040 domain-containing protein [Bacteroidales bacterium]|nr:DUF4040 domain-containing protein [Bacteroidales bacterium]MCF8333476.1 DUF4040 domain-containing protein [Bacteroidales bacterium]